MSVLPATNETISNSFRNDLSNIGEKINQETTENSHFGHGTHNPGSTNVKVRNIQHGK